MTDTAAPSVPTVTDRGDALAERLFLGGLAALELLTVEVGSRLGLYEALARKGDLTAGQLSEAAGIDERYAREWLEQQAVSGLLDVDDAAAPAGKRRYALAPECHDVLLDTESLRFMAAMPGFLVSFAGVMDDLTNAYRSGDGISFERFGVAMRDAQGAFNRPLFTHVLTEEWFPNALPDLDARLKAAAGARVADIGCGVGWASIAIARAYPDARVDGFDSDAPSIDAARKNAADAGVGDRVTFHLHDAASPAEDGVYDAVCIFEALHDMAQPVAALQAARRMLTDGGSCVVMDEKVADQFTAPGDEVERFMFTASVLHCLPVGLSEHPSAGTGTMLRRPVIERYAHEAGYTAITDLGVEHDFFRLYRLDR